MSKRKIKSDIKPSIGTNKKNYNFLFPIIIFIMAFIQYTNTLGHDYAWDDAIVIRDNIYTQDGLGSLKEIWTEPVYIMQRNIYRPIPQTTFALENYFFPDGNPAVGHFINVLLYAFCCFLLFQFFKLFLPQYHLIFAFLASLLFIVHPIHTEVVANIKSRDEILALSFGLASMIFFLKFLNHKRIGQVLLAILFLSMACLSKLNAITLLAIYPALYYFFPKENTTDKLGKFVLFSPKDTNENTLSFYDTLFPIQKILIGIGLLAITVLGIYAKNIYAIGFSLLFPISILFVVLTKQWINKKEDKKDITDNVLDFYDNSSIISKLIIALLIVGFMAFSIYDVFNSYLEIAAFIIPVYLITLFYHKISAWELSFLTSAIILFSYTLGLHYTADAALVLFLVYIIQSKTWNYKYFIPVALSFIPYCFIHPPFSFLIYAVIILILFKNRDKRLLYIPVIITIATFIIGDYEEGILYAILTLAGLATSYPLIRKVIPYIAIIGLVSFFLYENDLHNKSNLPPVSVEELIAKAPKVDRDSLISDQLELSIINNSLVNSHYTMMNSTIAGIQLEYLKKSVFPHPLIHNYGFNVIPSITWKHPKIAMTIVVFFLLFLFIILRIFKRDPIVFGLLFYFVTLSIYTNIVILAPDTMAERFLFFPSLGICLGFVFLLAGISKADLGLKVTANKNNVIFYSIFGLIMALGFFKTIDRNKDWKDNRTLATNTLPNAPNSALIHANYGGEWMHYFEVETQSTDQQAIQNAIAAVERSIEIHPKYFNAMLDLGMMYLKVGNVDKAKEIFNRSLEINPKNISPNLNLGLIYYSLGEYKQGIKVLEIARETNKKYAAKIGNDGFEQLYMFLARCYFNNGQLEEAKAIILEAATSLPENGKFYVLLGNMYANKNDFRNAVLYLEKALKIQTNDQDIINKMDLWKSNI
ncbi:MAG: Flp pilus assembly protein TadD [Maribacter sp.]